MPPMHAPLYHFYGPNMQLPRDAKKKTGRLQRGIFAIKEEEDNCGKESCCAVVVVVPCLNYVCANWDNVTY